MIPNVIFEACICISIIMITRRKKTRVAVLVLVVVVIAAVVLILVLCCVPTKTATRKPVTRCSLTSWMRGLSPGATDLLMTVRALAWVTERTVAADNQGKPNSAETPPTSTMMKRSRWKPVPFCNCISFLLTMSLTDTTDKLKTDGRV